LRPPASPLHFGYPAARSQLLESNVFMQAPASRLRRALPWLLATLLLAGCADPVTLENFDRIEQGMSQDDVLAILGEPDEISSMELGSLSGTLATWRGRKGVINVQIFNDEVWGKQFSPPGSQGR